MHVIVINRNQQKYVHQMREALKPIEPLFVFDRCEPVLDVNFIFNNEGENFLAGKMRDYGAKDIDDDILFLDGDKVPKGNILKDIESLKDKYDCICYGIDSDKENSVYRNFMKQDNVDGVVPWQLNRSSPIAFGCYTCGMFLKKEVIEKVRLLNNGRIFHPSFDGTWGDEDNFLADEVDYLGFKIGYSTHVRLSGEFSSCETKMDMFVSNFRKRLLLNKSLLGKKI